MGQKYINGFSPKEIYTLYSFLYIYEHERMKYLTETELLEKCPCMSEVFKIMESFKYEERTMERLKDIDENSITNEFYFTEYTSRRMAVLFHLRNSIAHAKICKVESSVYIEDFENKKKNPAHTAKGKIPFKVIEDIQNIMQEINNNEKMKQFNLTILLTMLMSMVGAKAFAHDIEVENEDGVTIYYKYINNNTELAVTYRGRYADLYSNEYTGSVVIPSSVIYDGNTYSVTSIGDYAFYECSDLISVIIPSSVTSIGVYAFCWCSSLASINFPNAISSIGEGAFSRCSSLTSITIPISVTSIGERAFYDCTAVDTLIYNATNCSDFEISSYYNNNYVFPPTISLLTFGENVTNIPAYFLYNGNQIESLTVPNSVTSIGAYSFFRCNNLKSATIGTGVLSIGTGAFSSPVKVIWLTNTPPSGYTRASGIVNYVANDQYGFSNQTVYPFLSSMFEVDGMKYVPVSPSERTCDAIDCAYNESAENIHIGSTVTNQGISLTVKQIHPYALYGNTSIKNVELSFGGDIGDYAFYGCTALESTELNNNGSIGEHAFASSNIVSTLKVNNTGNIRQSAFANITGDYTANINNIGEIELSAFSTSTGLMTLHIGDNVTQIGSDAFKGCTNLNNAQINNHGEIGENAYQNCTSLETVILGAQITSLGNNVFRGCSELQNIIIPNPVLSLGTYAFEGCKSLTSAKIGTGIQNIGTYTFSGCTSLTDMQIGSNVSTIDTCAFSNCSALSEITIPQSVTKINNNVFNGCSSLKQVVMADGTTELQLGSNGSNPLFAACPLDSVYIGRNISYDTRSSYGYSPFYRNTSLRAITITDVETEIPANEFYGCTNLKNVKIGNSVTSIGDWAFSGCSSLDNFEFGSAVNSIGKEAFSDCTAMTKLISHAVTPPTCDTQALDDINKWICALSVPTGYATAYQQADQWKEFFFINDDVEITGIENILSDSTENIVVYTLGGMKRIMKKTDIKSLPRGIYVINGKKVVVK